MIFFLDVYLKGILGSFEANSSLLNSTMASVSSLSSLSSLRLSSLTSPHSVVARNIHESTSSCFCAPSSTRMRKMRSNSTLKSDIKGNLSIFLECNTLKSYKRFQLNVTSKAGEITQEQFEDEVLKADIPVLVDFWSTWCGPCRLVVPAVNWAAKEYEGKLKVVKVETDASPELVEKYKVYGLPTIIIFKNGEVVDGSHKEGAFTQPKLKEYINEFL